VQIFALLNSDKGKNREKTMKKITITDLAEELGISPSTVSRALNNSPKISEKRRREINELAMKRSFKLRTFTRRTTNLCILIPSILDEENIISDFTGQVINGTNRYCMKNDIELSIFNSSREKLNRMNVVKELFRRNADGVIVLNASSDCTFIEQFEQEQVPYCCLLSEHPDYPDRTLTVDNQNLAERAVDYLLQLGHRHIAYLYSAAHNPAQFDRRQGYQNALNRAGLPIHKHLCPAPPLNSKITALEFGLRATSKLLNQNPETTAIFSANSELAEGAHLACTRKGLRIPEDLSLLACDNPPRAEYTSPPLTVVDIANDRFGAAAADWLQQQIRDPDHAVRPEEPWMKANLILRESTAPPRRVD
jgi:DNA-binding LacI/PurR family transcriptional regulator